MKPLKKFIKRPHVIEAGQFRVSDYKDGGGPMLRMSNYHKGELHTFEYGIIDVMIGDYVPIVDGDWVVKGGEGTYYILYSNDEFIKRYEPYGITNECDEETT